MSTMATSDANRTTPPPVAFHSAHVVLPGASLPKGNMDDRVGME